MVESGYFAAARHAQVSAGKRWQKRHSTATRALLLLGAHTTLCVGRIDPSLEGLHALMEVVGGM